MPNQARIGHEQRMNTCCDFSFCGEPLTALPSGALWWPATSLLVVSDLHLGKSERIARRGGAALPPYESLETLDRLAKDLDATNAAQVICLGDSFDDLAAAEALPEAIRLDLLRLQAGRTWIWIEGNHDPGPIELGGVHRAEWRSGPLVFRHIAEKHPVSGEISGHYHPKVRLQTRARAVTRPALLLDDTRLILPAYGTYTGGLYSHTPVLSQLFSQDARAILTGRSAYMVPMPRAPHAELARV